MRSLPNFLINSYHQLVRSNLVLKKDVSIENIKYFEMLLNRSIPSKDDKEIRAVYYFNKEKYHSNKNGFIKDISIISPMYISLILWTDNKQILKHFDLIGDIYLRWDKQLEKYIVEVYDINKRIETKPISILKRPTIHKSISTTDYEEYIVDYKILTDDVNGDFEEEYKQKLGKEEEPKQKLSKEDDKNDCEKFAVFEDEQDELFEYMAKKRAALEKINNQPILEFQRPLFGSD